jgi:hypothetical protein
MKKFVLLLLILMCIPAFQTKSEDPGAYIPWTLVGEGVKQGVYGEPSFYWRVNRGPTEYDGYYTFYLYLLSNSGQNAGAAEKYYQQQLQQQQKAVGQRTVRPTEAYDLTVYEVMTDEYGDEVYMSLIDPAYIVIATEIQRPIVFYSENEFPTLGVDWSEIRIY